MMINSIHTSLILNLNFLQSVINCQKRYANTHCRVFPSFRSFLLMLCLMYNNKIACVIRWSSLLMRKC